jgi:RNA polymerase sigma-70 factor (ECF subfamily)
MSTDSDAATVQACLEGDTGAFAKLVDKYEKKLFNTALRVVSDPEDAADATQSAFVKAYEKLYTFDPSYKFFSWIYRILLNESLNIVKRRKRFDSLDNEERPTELEAGARNPEEFYGDAEAGEQIREALAVLKADYRVVIELKHNQGMSYREMSEVVGVPEKTIKSRLFSARRQLRDILIKRGIER